MKTTKKSMTMKIVSVVLSIIMVVGVLSIVVSATEPEQEMVYISASDDANYINDKNGSPMAYVGVALTDLALIDLTAYGLGDYLYDADGDGNAEVTALHLYIYTHTTIFGLDWNEVTVTGGAGSIYFAGGLFGFSDENLRYNYNGAYPADENGWGFTADRIVLSAGDYLDVARFSDWSFYMDSAYGFHYFVDGNDTITHSYTVEEDTELSVKLMLVGGGMGSGDVSSFEAGYTISYGSSIGTATGTVTTDDSGVASITFSEAGTYYVWCDGGYGAEYPDAIVSSPANAIVTVTSTASDPATPRVAQDVSTTLDATLAQLAATITEPAFGTNAGEWTVLCLARGEYYAKDNVYFADYYSRIVETVNTTAASVNLNGALHKNKSTDNSRLIVALSAIGKDATSVGDWNLVEAYSSNGFDWIKKQGINGAIWALIALDSNNYATTDITIRQQCVDYILSLQKDDGGWTLAGTAADPDITGMTLQALYNYKDQEAVATACAEALTCLSNMQQESGGFLYGTSETSESAAQVIVALTTWGINPDTDSRFIKDGNSVIDAILAYYVENEAMFEHQLGAGANGMATDQACYALVAYDRLVNGKTSLYDYSDVEFETVTPPVTSDFSATLGLPENVEHTPGTTFNGVISVNGWNNDAGYKLLDLIVDVPEGLTVTGVTAGIRLVGGELNYNLDNGKLRIVYFDANENSDLTVNGSLSASVELFDITFRVDSVAAGDTLEIAVSEMSLKSNSDSSDETSVENITTDEATDSVIVVEGRTFSAKELYQGDGVDLIPSDKKAVMVTVTQLEGMKKLTYSDGTNTVEFKYNIEISTKLGVAAYIALIDYSISLTCFENAEYYTVEDATADSLTFGDITGDGDINAEDALAAVNMWLRKGDAPTEDKILTANVNGDSRIDTYDVLGIVEAFVYNDREYAIVTKSAIIAD